MTFKIRFHNCLTRLEHVETYTLHCYDMLSPLRNRQEIVNAKYCLLPRIWYSDTLRRCSRSYRRHVGSPDSHSEVRCDCSIISSLPENPRKCKPRVYVSSPRFCSLESFFFSYTNVGSYNGRFLTATAEIALLHFIRSCLRIYQCRGYTKVSSGLYGNCEIKARYGGSQTVASGGRCRRGSVQPGTSRSYREIALWLAGRHGTFVRWIIL